MSQKQVLDELFIDYLAGRSVKKKVAAFMEELHISDVDMLVDKVESIGDVDLYVDELERNAPAQSFFAFIDLISALILFLGPEAVTRAAGRVDKGGKYIPWLKKYLVDERFHSEIKKQLPAKFQQLINNRHL